MQRSSDSREPNADDGVHSEAELLDRIRQGDSEAFDAVARMHAPRLYRLALRLTGRVEDAEDLVQETLVRALPKLRKFEGRAMVSTYLIRAMTNLWKNRLRSKSRSRIVDWFRGGSDQEQADPGELQPDPAPSAEALMIGVDRGSALRRALQKIAPPFRLALLLREVEEMSYEEIAEMTESPIGTVRSRIARAKRDLRGILAPPEGASG